MIRPRRENGRVIIYLAAAMAFLIGAAMVLLLTGCAATNPPADVNCIDFGYCRLDTLADANH